MFTDSSIKELGVGAPLGKLAISASKLGALRKSKSSFKTPSPVSLL